MAFEVSGAQAGLDAAVDVLAVRGRLVVVGHPPAAQRRSTSFGLLARADPPRCPGLRAPGLRARGRSWSPPGAIPADALISAIVPLRQRPRRSPQLEAGKRVMKVLVDCQDGADRSEQPVRPDRSARRRHRRAARDRTGHGRGAGAGRCGHRRCQRAPSRRTGSEVEKRVRGAGRPSPAAQPTSPTATPFAGLADDIVALDRPVDILVNNAGTIAPRPGRRAPRRGLGPGPRGRTSASQFVLSRRARPGRCSLGQREDHLHRVPAQLPGWHQRPRLRGRQDAASPA